MKIHHICSATAEELESYVNRYTANLGKKVVGIDIIFDGIMFNAYIKIKV